RPAPLAPSLPRSEGLPRPEALPQPTGRFSKGEGGVESGEPNDAWILLGKRATRERSRIWLLRLGSPLGLVNTRACESPSPLEWPCRAASLLHDTDRDTNLRRTTCRRREAGTLSAAFDAVDDAGRQITRRRSCDAGHLAARADLNSKIYLSRSIWISGQTAIVARTETGSHARHDATRVPHGPTG